MKRLYIILMIFVSFQLFADDMNFTFKSHKSKSGFVVGLVPRNIPDEKGYEGSETTISPIFAGMRYNYNNFAFQLIMPLVVNPDDTKNDIMLNTVLLDVGYLWELENAILINGIQFTPAINIGSNEQNDLPSGLSFYVLAYRKVIWELSAGLNLQYYQSLSDKIKYNGLFLTRANSGFSVELRLEYYFEKEQLNVFSDILLFRDISNGISNIFVSPGVRFIIGDSSSVSVALSIPVYDDKFCERYGSGLVINFDKKF